MFGDEERQLKADLKDIKEHLFGATATRTRYSSFFSLFPDRDGTYEPSVPDQFESLKKQIAKQDLLLTTLFRHLKLEYHKVTDENGQTVVKHELRKMKKKKFPTRRNRDYDDED